MRHIGNDCHGCPECKGCGHRYKKYVYYTCDRCGKEISEEEINYTLSGKQLCNACESEGRNGS